MEKTKLIVDNILKTETIMGIIVLGMITLISCNMQKLAQEGEQVAEQRQEAVVKSSTYTVVIDPGHGGMDPGKIGINQQKEKDINLSISMQLRDLLLEQGYNVVMTRNEDVHLGEENGKFSKVRDLRYRCDTANEIYAADKKTITVCIHQNSFTDKAVSGPQVFHYGKSDKSRLLAQVMQDILNKQLGVSEPRPYKENNDYYMLLKTKCPTVIVECGFLSNEQEAAKLSSEEYQKTIARAILNGIEQYNMAIFNSL